MCALDSLAKVVLTFSATFALPVFAQANTVKYTITALGLVQHNYPRSSFYPNCINDNGVVAGSATVKVPHNTQQSTRGVLWQSSTRYTILGTLSESPGYDSAANWINNAGTAVGNSMEHVSGNEYVLHPVIFGANGIINLGVKNAQTGSATGINIANQVVGYLSFETPVQATQAFLYQNGTMTLLGYPVPTIGYSQAYAINNNGLIVGSAQFSANTPPHAATYTNGTWNDLGTLGLTFSGYASAVNDSGTIVGIWANRAPPYQIGVFIYQNGKMTDLNAPGVSGLGTPIAINNANQIVINQYIYQNGVWQDLNTLIDPASGWKVAGATAINNEGVIAIYDLYQNPDQQQAGLLTPVSPN